MQRIMSFLRKVILDNKKKIAVIALVLLLTTFVLYNMNSYRLKGDLPSSAKGFDDENFYRCVIDNYNDFRGTSLTWYDDLPDDAKELTYLDCSRYDIEKVNEIEYFTNLKSVNLRDNKINDVNFSFNKLLEEIDLSNNSLYGLDLEYNTNLKSINLINAFKSNAFQDITIKKGDVKNLGSHVYLPSGYDVKYVYDESIISFDGNDITGLSSGTTTLNAENDTFGYLFSFKVNVIEDESEPLKVTLDDSDWSIIDGYIFTQDETNKDTILNKIKVNKGEVSYTNDNYDEIQITYDNNTLATYKIANFSSDTYIVGDYDQGYSIYVLNDNIDQKYLNLTNCEIEQDELNVYVKISGKRVEKLRAMFIYSDKHDLLKDYILFENNDQNDIKAYSQSRELETKELFQDYGDGSPMYETDDKISILCNDDNWTCWREYKKLRINFDGYEVVDGVINTTKKNDDFASVTTTNCEKEVKDGKLLVKYNGEIIKTYTINVVDKNIVTTTKKEEDKTEDKKATTKEVSKNGTTNTTNKKIDDFIPKTESDTTTTKTTTRIEDKYNAIDAKLRSLSKRNSNRNIIILLLSLTAVILSLIIVNMLLKIKKSKKK